MVPSKLFFSMLIACFLGSVIVTHAQSVQPTCALAQPGDGFIRIAARCGVDPKQLLAANRGQRWFRNANYVPQGVSLSLPALTAPNVAQLTQGPLAVPLQRPDASHLAEDLRVKRALSEALAKVTDLEKRLKEQEAAMKKSQAPAPVAPVTDDAELQKFRERIAGYDQQLDNMAQAMLVLIGASIVLLVTSLGFGIAWYRLRRRMFALPEKTRKNPPVPYRQPEAPAAKEKPAKTPEEAQPTPVAMNAKEGDEDQVIPKPVEPVAEAKADNQNVIILNTLARYEPDDLKAPQEVGYLDVSKEKLKGSLKILAFKFGKKYWLRSNKDKLHLELQIDDMRRANQRKVQRLERKRSKHKESRAA